MIDKNLSMSSFLALRYTEKNNVDFTEKLPYRHPSIPEETDRILVKTAEDIGVAIEGQIAEIRKKYRKMLQAIRLSRESSYGYVAASAGTGRLEKFFKVQLCCTGYKFR